MHQLRLIRICCALILFGALFACTPEATPIVPPTLTLIAPTITPTFTPSPTLRPTEAVTGIVPQVTQTPDSQTRETLLPLSVLPDWNLVDRMIGEMASDLDVAPGRIRIVTAEPVSWIGQSGICPAHELILLQAPIPSDLTHYTGMRYVFLIGNSLYDYYVLENSRTHRCDPPRRLSGDLLLELDPGAREMLLLAQRRLAEELDLSTHHITVVAITPYLWRDTGLGCPQSDQQVQSIPIQGYRIELEAGERQYIYHTDTVSVFSCPQGREQLPSP
jgi:hypothetical protein